jgi:hypothetical protein
MRKLIMFGVALALTVALAAPATSSAAVNTYLKYDGIGETSPGSPPGCIDCSPPTMHADGIVECTVCIPGKPTSGTVSISLIVTTARHNPCKVKRVSGTLEVAWNDGSISTGELGGKLRGSDLKLAGAFYPSDPVYPVDPIKLLLNDFPPNPCVLASNAITGTMQITAR